MNDDREIIWLFKSCKAHAAEIMIIYLILAVTIGFGIAGLIWERL